MKVKKITPENINNEAQNKPSGIAYDLLKLSGVPTTVTYYVLLKRGVFKWLANRRHLIKFKDYLRREEHIIQVALARAKQQNRDDCLGKHTGYWRGYRDAIQMCRKYLRRICHSPRWQSPDNDRHANRFMKGLAAANYAIDHGLVAEESVYQTKQEAATDDA